jgi:hypothetical protein
MHHAWAWQVMDRVYVRVVGTKPTPCYRVKLTEYLGRSGDGAALQLGLFWSDPGDPCIRRVSRYAITQSFFVGRMLVEQVRIDHAEGSTDVQVQRLPFTPGPLGTSGVTAEEEGGSAATQYTGWSRASFDEAYRNAVEQVPVEFPDDLLNVRVVASGGLRGGFPGFDDVFVTVQRVDPPVAEASVLAAGQDENGGCTGVVYHAEQVPGMVILNAYGEHPTSGWTTFFEQLPIKIWPPQFRLVCIPPSGASADVITPFEARTCFRAGDRVEAVTVHDADGSHEIPVEYVPD